MGCVIIDGQQSSKALWLATGNRKRGIVGLLASLRGVANLLNYK